MVLQNSSSQAIQLAGAMKLRRPLVLAQISGFVLLALALFSFSLHRDLGGYHRRPGGPQHQDPDWIPPGAVLSQRNITTYLTAILDSEDRSLPRLECPQPNLTRYTPLKPTHPNPSSTPYFFALDLRNNLPILPRLLGSIISTINFLGPSNCALSIVEGNSADGTPEVLSALQSSLGSSFPTHFILRNEIDPLAEDRFGKLAILRNLALEPMLRDPNRYAESTTVFINDVAICMEDILELIYQKRYQNADMACAFDWIGGGEEGEAVFYDSYIARGINGDLFFEIPLPSVSWSRATDLFWNDEKTKGRFEGHVPFQVFSCWNGAVAFTAKPVVSGEVKFRSVRRDRGECHQGEPQLFCKDMWWAGYGKIMVVPSVNLEYSDEKGRYIKEMKGYTGRWAGEEKEEEERIEWVGPPEKVKCMPTFDDQTWRDWNETLG
ncbi:cryptococcal mannosyltransferase 1-domain-containing protein [Immersiella caudata]|uniref:Cryptococcal mannosyltransferase 1-domain-containing protein n=1 Tax=Immersiella caudata TaxID=314043 RepID=A0AA39XE63_9PEZI|nr:cryptococcal mannosyltransferase 1-domain-containing protein [Immersiella caudata]